MQLLALHFLSSSVNLQRKITDNQVLLKQLNPFSFLVSASFHPDYFLDYYAFLYDKFQNRKNLGLLFKSLSPVHRTAVSYGCGEGLGSRSYRA